MKTSRAETPSLVIAGAARCGTSFLAARLSSLPEIDPGSLKEPNFFSRHFERGLDWYEKLFKPRDKCLIRLDASMSYTFPQHPDALPRLAATAPQCRLVYAVRDPIERAMSHYRLNRGYFGHEKSVSFGAALRANPVYAGTSDYAHWLAVIGTLFPPEQVLIVPFAALTGDGDAGVTAICEQLLGVPPPTADVEDSRAHRNEVVTFRSATLRSASRRLRHSRLYPLVRERLGAGRLRQVRRLVTRELPRESTEEMWASCTAAQKEELLSLTENAHRVVEARLRAQEARTKVGLLPYWDGPTASEPPRDTA